MKLPHALRSNAMTLGLVGLAGLIVLLALVGLLAPSVGSQASAQDADLIVRDARVWTGDAARPWAEAVAVRGERILAVGDAGDVERHRGAQTRVIDAAGGFVSPGFIDNHTHFSSAGALLLGINLLDVADEAGLIERVRAARDRMPDGAWITGGDWGAYEAWEMGSAGADTGRAAGAAFRPHRGMIDSITPNSPVLLSKWDRSAYLANGRAIELAGIACGSPGVECEAGEPTGRLSPAAAAGVRRVIPAKSLEQRLAEAHAALERLRSLGVTTIHDNTPPDQFRVYQELHRRGELTVRVYARPTLDKWDELAAVGIRHGYGDEWLKVGGLKGFVDGIMGNSSARFYEPYLTSGELGSWRDMMEPDGDRRILDSVEPVDWAAADAGPMERMLLGADSAGHWPQVHAIGDAAIDTLIDMFERVMATNGPRDRRFRVIHTQVLHDASVARRMADLDLIAEVQPYHAIDDMRWMEERIGDRARWAYAFRTLDQAGVRLSFGSDWPGTNAAWYTANPLMGMYAAVTRQTLDGEPEGGWFPEERIDVETALRAYTVNNAYAAGEEQVKGAIAPGMLADLVLLDRDPFAVPPAELKDVGVLTTIVGGRVVFDASAERVSSR